MVTKEGLPTNNSTIGVALGDVVARPWSAAPIYVDLTWTSSWGKTLVRAPVDQQPSVRATEQKRKWALKHLSENASAHINFIPCGIGTDGVIAPSAREALKATLSDKALVRVVAAGLMIQAKVIVDMLDAAHDELTSKAQQKRDNRWRASLKASMQAITNPLSDVLADGPSSDSDDSDDDSNSSASAAAAVDDKRDADAGAARGRAGGRGGGRGRGRGRGRSGRGRGRGRNAASDG
jgi:hypothetical protein